MERLIRALQRRRSRGSANVRLARVGVAVLSTVAALTYGPAASAEPEQLSTMVFIYEQERPNLRACG